MALITWDENLSVCVAEIDQQHQKLVSMINELHDAMKSRKANEALGKIIDGLIDYTVNHFQFEEKFFHKFSYPDTRAHKREHDQFVEKVKDVKSGFDNGHLMLSLDLMNFLKDWLQNHIKRADKKYAPFFNENGLH